MSESFISSNNIFQVAPSTNWVHYKLEQLCRKNDKSIKIGPFGSQLKKEYLVPNGYKVYGQENIYNQNMEIGDRFITHNHFKILESCRLIPGDFIISMMGTIGQSMVVPDDIAPGIMDSHLIRLRFNKTFVNLSFIKQYFSSSIIQKQLAALTVGGIMDGLSSKIIKQLVFIIPPLPEQQAVAEVLSDMDALIQAQEALIAKKKLIKQGVMQELLTGKRRLPGFVDNWKQYKISDFASVVKGRGLSKSKLNSNGINKCVLYGELFTTYDRVINHVISSTDIDDGVPSISGDVLIPGSTTTVGVDLAIASCLLINNVRIGGDVNIIRSNSSLNYSPRFLAHYITDVMKEDISRAAQGITIIHLYGKDIADLCVRIPSYVEQEKISDVVDDLNNEILLLQNTCDKYKLIKQCMMQELLTGKTRLVYGGHNE
jgi:type I restriction enzyme S subunit